MKALERVIQAFVVERLKVLERDYLLTYAADLGGQLGIGARKMAFAKQQGWQPGEPDLRISFSRGRTVYIELKRQGAKLNYNQEKRIAMLRGLGFKIHIVEAATGQGAWDRISQIILEESS